MTSPAPSFRIFADEEQTEAPKPEVVEQPKAEPAEPNESIIDYWKAVFVSVYNAYYVAQVGHWHIESIQFNDIHAFFQAEYTALALMIDTVAEHTRTKQAFLPCCLTNLAEGTPKFNETSNAKELLANYLGSIDAVSKLLAIGNKNAESMEASDVDLIGELSRVFDKSRWKLNSMLKTRVEASATLNLVKARSDAEKSIYPIKAVLRVWQNRQNKNVTSSELRSYLENNFTDHKILGLAATGTQHPVFGQDYVLFEATLNQKQVENWLNSRGSSYAGDEREENIKGYFDVETAENKRWMTGRFVSPSGNKVAFVKNALNDRSDVNED